MDAEDLIFYKQNDLIISGGYTINSVLLKQGLSPMTTLNIGGVGGVGGGTNVSSLFENLAIPAGLFFINKTPDKFFKYDCDTDNHEPLADDIHDILFGMIETDKKQKRKTRKHLPKIVGKSTTKRVKPK